MNDYTRWQHNDTFDKDARIIILKYFYRETEAKLYALKLKEAGIRSFISNANMHGVLPIEHGGITLHIREEDATLAQQIIEGLDLQKESNTPDFYYDTADPIDVEIEKGLIATRRQKPDYTFKMIVVLLLIIIVAALLTYIRLD